MTSFKEKQLSSGTNAQNDFLWKLNAQLFENAQLLLVKNVGCTLNYCKTCARYNRELTFCCEIDVIGSLGGGRPVSVLRQHCNFVCCIRS